MDEAAAVAPEVLTAPDGATIAYHRTHGRSPGVVFLTGYSSDMTGQKAVALEAFCRARGNAFVRFDYLGHGRSSGAFVDGTVGRWCDDAVLVLDRLTAGPQILVGSSLGGWIMVLAALRRRSRVAGLLGLAAAPDFTEDLIVPELSPADRQRLDTEGVIMLANPYGEEPTPVTKAIIDDGRKHLVLRADIPLACPVRLIHGLDDHDVPWRTSVRLAERLKSADCDVTLIKGAGHRLSEDADIARLTATLERLLVRVGNGRS